MRQYRLYVPIILLILCLSFYLNSVLSSKDIYLKINYSQLTPESQEQVRCLADNIYYEAGYEPDDGKLAVALVTMNRLQDPRYPKDICSVVKQKVRSTCQFSWFCENVKAKRNEVYNKAMEVALDVHANHEKLTDITYGALFYHADYVNPRWKLEKTTVIGRHIFYKESEGKDDAKNEHSTKGRSVF